MFFQRLQHFGQNKPATNDITPLGHKESCRTQSDLLLWLKLLLSDWTPESYSGQLHDFHHNNIWWSALTRYYGSSPESLYYSTPSCAEGRTRSRSLSLSLSPVSLVWEEEGESCLFAFLRSMPWPLTFWCCTTGNALNTCDMAARIDCQDWQHRLLLSECVREGDKDQIDG